MVFLAMVSDTELLRGLSRTREGRPKRRDMGEDIRAFLCGISVEGGDWLLVCLCLVTCGVVVSSGDAESGSTERE